MQEESSPTVLLNLVSVMNWQTPIDNYCERADAGFWAEPLNAISNVAFLIAAFLAYRYWRKLNRPAPLSTAWLLLLLSAIGIGSFLFHTFANTWSLLADVLPIMIFIVSYLALVLRRALGLNIVLCVIGIGGYFILSMLAQTLFPEDFLNGSAGYLPAYILMFGFGLPLWRTGDTAQKDLGKTLLIGTIIFTASLCFRTLDAQHGALCSALPSGLHWAWHGLNGLLLGYLIWGYVNFNYSRITA